MKPKAAKKEGGGYDNCGTPSYALYPILRHIEQFDYVIETADNEDHLIYDALRDWGTFHVATNYSIGYNPAGADFFTDQWIYDEHTVQVTNPPFSIKYKWLTRSYELGFPFALLLPVETLGAVTAQRMFKKHGMELIVMSQRVNFKMPVKGWACQAQFPVAWFTWKLNIGREISYATIDNTLSPVAPLHSEYIYDL